MAYKCRLLDYALTLQHSLQNNECMNQSIHQSRDKTQSKKHIDIRAIILFISQHQVSQNFNSCPPPSPPHPPPPPSSSQRTDGRVLLSMNTPYVLTLDFDRPSAKTVQWRSFQTDGGTDQKQDQPLIRPFDTTQALSWRNHEFQGNCAWGPGGRKAPWRGWGAEPLMGARWECPLKLKKFCHLEVKFAVFFFFFFIPQNFSSRGHPRYRGKGYCLTTTQWLSLKTLLLLLLQCSRVSVLLDQLLDKTGTVPRFAPISGVAFIDGNPFPLLVSNSPRWALVTTWLTQWVRDDQRPSGVTRAEETVTMPLQAMNQFSCCGSLLLQFWWSIFIFYLFFQRI